MDLKPKLTGRDRIEALKQQAKDKTLGVNNMTMPITTIPKLNNFMGGMQRGLVIGITAEANVGKTPLVKSLLYSAYKSFKKNPTLKFRCFFFALEESEEQFIDSLILTMYYEKYNKFLDQHLLLSVSKHSASQAIWDEIDTLCKDIDDFLTCVRVIDYIYNPHEIFEICEKRIKTLGEFEGNKFKYKDPSVHYFCIVDNLNLFRSEDYKERHTLMEVWSAQYAVAELGKKYKWTIIDVIQQSLDPNREQYTKGARIISKLEPSLHSLGNNKEIARHHQVILGLFAPSYYEVETYHHHEIKDFPDHTFRTVFILRNRYGKPRAYIDLVLMKNTFIFMTLPHYKDPEYEIVKQRIITILNSDDPKAAKSNNLPAASEDNDPMPF